MAQTQPVMYEMSGPTTASVNVRSEQRTPRFPPSSEERATKMLLVYMIDYLEKHAFRDTAEALRRESKLQKVEKPKINSSEGLLWEWWACFWEIYFARVQPNGLISQVAKDYSENLYQDNVERYRQSVRPPVSGAPGPTRPYVNGGPPPAINGHAPFTQYPTSLQGAQGGPMPISGNSGSNPTPLQNPTLQHLQAPPPPRMINGKPFSGPGMPLGPSGVPYPIHPGVSMPPRPMPNGVHPQPNPNARPSMAQQSNSPQNPDSYASPRNTDSSNPPATEDIKMESIPKTPRSKPARGQKRPSEEESPPKGETTPKKQKRSPPGNGGVFPSPSLASAQPGGIPRPPSGAFPTPAQVQAGTMSIPPHPIPVGNGGPPPPLPKVPGIGPPGSMPGALQNQLQHLEATASSRGNHRTSDLQYFQQAAESTMTAYGVKPFAAQPAAGLAAAAPNPGTDLTGSINRPGAIGAVGATNGHKGAMLPPPLPGSSTLPQTPTNAPKAIMNGLVPPANTATKDGSPKIDSHSPENARPGSRPISSTPQPIPSAPTPTGIVSTPGGPSSMSAPSPAQLATPQQTSRPHSQSPNARPTTAGAGAPITTPVPTPAVLMARQQGAGASTPSNPTPSPALMNGGPTLSSLGATPGSGDSLPGDLFDLGSLGNLGGAMNTSFDPYQMMNFQDSGMDGGMPLDFNFSAMDDFYLDSAFDPMTGA